MSPVCPRCGGELRPASINAWVHVWQDKEDDCYMRGKDGSEVRALPTQDSESPVPAIPDDVGVQKEPSHSVVGEPFSIQEAIETRKAIRDTPGAVTWTAEDVRVALLQRRLPLSLYRQLTAYAALYAPNAVFRGRDNRLVLRYSSDSAVGTTSLTDAEITEALR